MPDQSSDGHLLTSNADVLRWSVGWDSAENCQLSVIIHCLLSLTTRSDGEHCRDSICQNSFCRLVMVDVIKSKV